MKLKYLTSRPIFRALVQHFMQFGDLLCFCWQRKHRRYIDKMIPG